MCVCGSVVRIRWGYGRCVRGLGEIFRGKSHGAVEDIQITLDVRCSNLPSSFITCPLIILSLSLSLNDIDMP